MIGALVHHIAHGRGIIIDVEHARCSGHALFHVRWDEPVEWNGVPRGNFCWVDDEDVEILSDQP